ncbi:MAG: DMT family transporter [Proteobacteria bacterium]|jgi:drug/metabolite transporter (DMT)-like permease|nr:DMT family transporter [Pseudomonadota bacterium]
MSVPAAYIGIIIVWSTTPLAIKWSSDGVGFLFGVTSRMLLGATVCSLIMLVLMRKLPWHRAARQTYLAAGLGIYGAMMCVYWGAQYIPSGLISVLFGLSPILTGILAAVWLGESGLTPGKLIGIVFGITGLILIFGTGIKLGEGAGYGILAVLVSVAIHSTSTVWVKSISARLPALEVVNGGLLVAAPLYLLTWWMFDGVLPAEIPQHAVVSIIYLAIIGSVLGFFMFYYVLRHIDASRVALVTLITPVMALFIGQIFNHESIAPVVWIGTCCILLGMSVYQWGSRLYQWRAQRCET